MEESFQHIMHHHTDVISSHHLHITVSVRAGHWLLQIDESQFTKQLEQPFTSVAFWPMHRVHTTPCMCDCPLLTVSPSTPSPPSQSSHCLSQGGAGTSPGGSSRGSTGKSHWLRRGSGQALPLEMAAADGASNDGVGTTVWHHSLESVMCHVMSCDVM